MNIDYAKLVKNKSGEVLSRQEAQKKHAKLKSEDSTGYNGLKFWCAWHRARDKACQEGIERIEQEILEEEFGLSGDESQEQLFECCVGKLQRGNITLSFSELNEWANITFLETYDFKKILLGLSGFLGKLWYSRAREDIDELHKIIEEYLGEDYDEWAGGHYHK